MQIPVEVISALIGAATVLAVILVKDIMLDIARGQQQAKRELIRQRLEKAYVPLNYFIYALMTSEGNTSKSRSEILTILRRYGHLLTEQTLSGLYLLVDQTVPTADDSTLKRFIQEYEALRDAFYKDRASSLSILPAKA